MKEENINYRLIDIAVSPADRPDRQEEVIVQKEFADPPDFCRKSGGKAERLPMFLGREP